MPEKAIYTTIAREFKTTPWDVEKNMSLEWYQFFLVWFEEKYRK